MALKGTLKDFGIADILQLIGHQLKTGVLKLTTKGQEVRVYFTDGNVVNAESSTRDKRDLLGSLLVRAEVITQEQLETTLEIQKRTLKRLGDILVDSGYIAREKIRDFTRLQTTETIYKLFLWKTGTYEFEQTEVDFDVDSYEPIRSESVLMEGFRMVDEWPFIRKRISSYAMRFEILQPLPQEEEGGDADADADDDFLAGIDDAFSAMEESDQNDERKTDVGANERLVFGLISPERDVQKLIDLSCLGEFETCKALLNLLNAEILAAIPPQKGVDASAPSEMGALDSARASARLIPALVRVGMTAALLLLVLLLVRVSGFEPRALFQPSVRVVDHQPIEEALGRHSQDRLERALELYFLEQGRFPASLDKLPEEGLLRAREVSFPWEDPFAFRSRGDEYSLRRPFR